MEEIDIKLVVGAVGVDGGSWLELLSCGVNQGWVSESLVKLLKISQAGPTSELLVGGSQQPPAFAYSDVLPLPTCRYESEMTVSLGYPSRTRPRAGESEDRNCAILVAEGAV